jgi:hypothetical protein
MTLAQALQEYFPNSAGVLTAYRRCDLECDLQCQRLRVEVPTPATPTAVIVPEAECMHNAVMMALAGEESSEVHNMTLGGAYGVPGGAD